MLKISILAAVSIATAACSDSSPEGLCKKVAELAKKEGAQNPDKMLEACTKQLTEEKSKLSAEMWAKVAACVNGASSMSELSKCDPDKLAAEGGGGGAADEYVKKSKGTEAQTFIRKMYEGARAYYMDEHMAPGSMAVAAPQFPGPSVGPTPPKGACCKQGGKCAPDAAQWTAPTWTALMFSVDDPHYYSYEYKVSDDKKSVEIMAYGDLDCDGEYSTFKISGKAGADGPPPPAEIEKIKPME